MVLYSSAMHCAAVHCHVIKCSISEFYHSTACIAVRIEYTGNNDFLCPLAVTVI